MPKTINEIAQINIIQHFVGLKRAQSVIMQKRNSKILLCGRLKTCKRQNKRDGNTINKF